MSTFRFPLDRRNKSGDSSAKIVSVQPLLAADGLSENLQVKEALNRTSSVFLTSLSFAIIPKALSGSVSEHVLKGEFNTSFAKNISNALNELLIENEDLRILSTSIQNKETSFFAFQKEWMRLASKGLLVQNLLKYQGLTKELNKLNKELRFLRCHEADPETLWSTSNSKQRQGIRQAIRQITTAAESSICNFAETWTSVTNPQNPKIGLVFRIDSPKNLTSIITRELRQRNKNTSITFIYIVMGNSAPILTSLKSGVFGILSLAEEPHTWVFSCDQNKLDELKPMFANDEKLDSKYLTATMALGVTLFAVNN